jgi:hypothetical protein
MTDELDRVRMLLARAGHVATPEEEARTAALIAARAITRLGLVVGRDDHQHAPRSVRPEATSERASERADTPTWSGVARQRDGFVAPASHPATSSQASRPAASSQASRPAARSEERKEEAEDFRVVSYKRVPARRDGVCVACGRRFEEAEQIAWVPGSGSTHWGCREHWYAEEKERT